jgi:hypothetical protein
MSLDIKVKKKKLVVPPKVIQEFPEKSKSVPSTKRSKQNGLGWWVLFVVLLLLFIGVIYIIWSEQKNNDSLSVVKKNNAGIVSTFISDSNLVKDNQKSIQPTEFSLAVVDTVVTEFTNKLFLFKQKISSPTTNNTNLTVAEVYASAQLTFTTLQEQYQLLKQNFKQQTNSTSTSIYESEIEVNMQRLQGEFNIVATIIDLDNISFLNEIIISFEKLDKYFQEINNLLNIIYYEINPDLIIVENISTSTVQMTTTTDVQVTSTNIL